MQESNQLQEQKLQKLSVGKIEVLLEQNEEDGKSMHESSLPMKSLSYDDDIVEYSEENISTDELTSMPSAINTENIEKVVALIGILIN